MSEYSVRKLLSETDLKLLSSYDSEKLRLSSKENNEDQLLLLKYVDMLNKTVQ